MDISILERQFSRIGARVRVHERTRPNWGQDSGMVTLDIAHDRRGEYFDVRITPGSRPEMLVLNLEPKLRHLLLMTREHATIREKHKFLCGHDERHWFVAAVPDGATSTVRNAMEALKPAQVRERQSQLRLSQAQGHTRHNAAFLRQGEWFFVPVNGLRIDPRTVLNNERLSRGRGKSHWLEYAYRTGGERVYVSARYPTGITEAKYRELMNRGPRQKNQEWRIMVRNPGLYARGRVRHPDHATIVLHDWHQVLMNRESEAPAMRHVAFLD
ncbi:MAG: hypothetical protein SFX18_03890 [Pirellulales bacterium]|nr:hypothetical protein [Pirellulales bacterium]